MNDNYIFTEIHKLYKANNLHDSNNLLIKDGIINTTLFNCNHIRLLFIAKEHNYIGGSNEEDYKADYRDWWNHHVKFQFSHRISEWSYGILNNFDTNCEQISYDQKHKSLRSIAFINVKKTSGNSSANPKIICDYISYSQNLLHQQIRDIAPTLIICCFRHNFYLEQLFGSDLVWASSKRFSYGKWNGIDVINFYHPSSRKNKISLYELMKEVIEQVKTT